MFILGLVHSPQDAEEILGDTNLLLWEKFEEFQPGTDFRAWACRIAHYRVLKFRERQRFRSKWLPLSDEILSSITETTIRHVDILESRRIILGECLQKLPEQDRELLDRRHHGGATIAQISQEIGRPLEGLYKVYQRIYRTLAECIDRGMSREGGQ